MDIFLSFLVVLLASLVLNVILKHFAIPPIIGYILVGIAAGSFATLDGQGETLSVFAEFGIVFLMFMLGLEFSVSHMRAMKREVFVLGSLQMLVTAALFGAIAHFGFDYPHKEAIVIGAALALSSTAIVIKILQDNGHLHRNHGRISLGILLMQDIAVVPILIMIAIFSNQGQSVDQLLLQTAINSLSVLVAIYIFGKYVVSYFLRFVSTADSSELFMSAVLVVVLSSAWIAHFFHISYSLGAFIAGMMLAESRYKYQIEADLTPFKDLSLGLFFLTVGMLVDMSYVMKHWQMIMITVVVIMVLKTLLIFGISNLFYSRRTAIKSAIFLSQVGEFSFVIFALAKTNHILDNPTSQILIATVIVSMISTPLIAKYVTPISYRFTNDQTQEAILHKTQHLKDHIVVVGFGNVGKRVVNKLIEHNIPYLVIEFKQDLVYDGQDKGYNVVFGNASKISILDKANLAHASVAIITNEDEDELLRISALISFRYPRLHLVARAKNKREYDMLTYGGRLLAIDQSDHISDLLIAKAFECHLDDKEHHTRL